MKIILLGLLFVSSLFAQNTINMKKCEVLQMSKYTKLFSCHKVDYIVEYKIDNDITESDSIKKITVVTPTSQVVLK